MKHFAALVLMTCLSAGAAAQLRSVPVQAERGFIRHIQGALVEIDGRQLPLAPGATIRGPNNLILVSTALPAEGAFAQYLLDADGQVVRVWLLSPEEAERDGQRAP
jgi:hypothetical protein